MSSPEIKKSRLCFVYFAILMMFGVVILRMFFVVVGGDRSRVSDIYDDKKNARRGDIYDRNGIIVATDLQTKSLYVNTILIKSAQNVASGLVKVFPELSYEELLKKITNGQKSHNWVFIRRNLSPGQVNEVENLQMAGLVFEDSNTRVYPQKSITSHLVGYVDVDRNGLAGIEAEYSKELMRGQDIYLAMDVRMQDVVHDELVKGLEQFGAEAGAGIIMDVNSGEVLALSSLPDFDPNLQHKASPNQRFNRVTNAVYELGSVFKIFTNVLGFEDNTIKPSDVYDVKEPIKYGRFTIDDDHKSRDVMTVEEVFAYSSNIGTVKIMKNLDLKKQKKLLESLNMLKKLDVRFPGLGKPIYPKIWREINSYTIAYGHGIAVTPLHLASAVSAVSNGGVFVNPSFLKLENPPLGQQVIKQETSRIIREMMRKVVVMGTGKYANIEGYSVGGKTGTAEIASVGGYSKKHSISSFVAIFPVEKPQYLVYVVLDRPNYIFNTGGMVAAPVAGRIIKNIAPIVGLIPVEPEIIQ
jgi:cell division protein FtsI (penicillin-binding protein 3)